jgi:hypothetical protein
LERKEAVALLKELGNQLFVSPRMVLIECRKVDGCQLKIRGEYSYEEIELFLKNRGYSYEINEDYLTISRQ